MQLPDVAEVAAAGVTGTAWDAVPGKHPTPDSVHLKPERIDHILVGEENGGGGHRPGRRKKGKSEFPPSWSDAKIVAAVLTVARNPRDIEPPDPKGMRMFRGTVDQIVIEGYIGANGYVWTGYPLSGPGVIRNPS